MRNLTQGMTVKETQAWIAERRKNFKNMTFQEINEFNKELEMLRQEDESKWDSKVFSFLERVGVWIGAALIIIGGMAYKLL